MRKIKVSIANKLVPKGALNALIRGLGELYINNQKADAATSTNKIKPTTL